MVAALFALSVVDVVGAGGALYGAKRGMKHSTAIKHELRMM
jgi:hypothetical protein